MPQLTARSRHHHEARRIAEIGLVSPEGLALPLRSTVIEADARGGLASVALRQVFVNTGSCPLAATYRFPLPADAALGGYAFTVDGVRTIGTIDRRDLARERYEEAMVDGRTAGLVEQERSAFFVQQLGNIPPGASIECELRLDQPLRWLAGGRWEWRFPTVFTPRYLGGPGRVSDAERTTLDRAGGPASPWVSFTLRLRDREVPLEVECPSHGIVVAEEEGRSVITLERSEPLDRDLVVRWSAATAEPGVSLDLARPVAGHAGSRSAYGLLTIVPPGPAHDAEAVPRDLILLLDTCGSMAGRPLGLAAEIAVGLIESLGPEDTLELVEFSTAASRWRDGPARATREARADAASWVRRLGAGGGTEMQEGLLASLASCRKNAQRQVVLITDGCVGFEREITTLVERRLPLGSRVHAVGIGSAANRSLTGAVARVGGGAEFLVGLDDDPREAVRCINARLVAPLLVGVTARGTAVRAVAARIGDLAAGCPVRVPLELRPEGGVLTVEGRTARGVWSRSIAVEPVEPGLGPAAVSRMFARERVEDLEARGDPHPALDEEVERLGLVFGISTRLTAWIAVSEGRTVDPREPVVRASVPQTDPYGYAGADPAELHSAIFHASWSAHRGSDMPAAAMDAVRTRSPGAKAHRGRHQRDSAHSPRPTFAGPAEVPAPEEPVARLVTLADGRTVLEFTLAADLAWDPLLVSFDAPGGIDIDPDGTTRAGPCRAGQTVRLVFRAGPGTPPPRFIRVECADGGRAMRIAVVTA
jgi:Ca-activated chloride channel family protein